MSADLNQSNWKKRALRGGMFEMSAYGLSQVLRLGGNLVLTRLLLPEAFGLMQTLTVFNSGIILLSDVGIEQSVIQNPNGGEERFRNTAWTIQVIRGGLLYAFALVAAWPMAHLERTPELLWLLPVSALAVPAAGFGSTSEFTLRRKVQVAPILLLDLVTQILGLVFMLTWAYLSPSIWALLIGNVFREVLRSLGTHYFLIPGYRNRFLLDADYRKEIERFGRWILGSSAVYFFAGMADRLLLLPLIGSRALGIFSVAAMLTEAAHTVFGKITHGVLFPIFGKVKDEGIKPLRAVYYAARARLDALSQVGIGGLVFVGPLLINWLWHPPYTAAAWMLQILCVRAATRALFDPAEKCLMALGHVRTTFLNNVARAVVLFVAVPVGYHLGGTAGVLWGLALTDLPSPFLLWGALWKHGVLRLEREALAILLFGVGLALGFLVHLVVAGLTHG